MPVLLGNEETTCIRKQQPPKQLYLTGSTLPLCVNLLEPYLDSLKINHLLLSENDTFPSLLFVVQLSQFDNLNSYAAQHIFFCFFFELSVADFSGINGVLHYRGASQISPLGVSFNVC